MAWRVDFHPDAERELQKLDPQTARRILKFAFERIAVSSDPRMRGEALKGSKLGEFWKYRIGDYRLIARIEDRESLVLLLRVAHRSQVYRRS